MYIELFKDQGNVFEICNKGKSIYYFNNYNLFSGDKNLVGEFKKINFFIGSNNSGKSRFLRGLLKYESIYSNLLPSFKTFEDIKLSIVIKTYTNNLEFLRNLTTYNEFSTPLSDFCHAYKNITGANIINNSSNFVKAFEANNLLIESIDKIIDRCSVHNRIRFEEIKVFCLSVKELENFANYAWENKVNNKVYIPTLRSSTRNNGLASDTFNKVVFENYALENDVFTGLKLYEELSNKKNSSSIERKKVKEFEKFLSKTFFDNKEVEITANNKQPATILFSVDEHEFPIHDIGDGIQMLVILLFPIFTANDNSWFFIEEPETHLHPGLQRIFVETLLKDEYLNSKNLRYFFTTHSNHFLDLSLITDSVSIFQFQKESQEKFNIKNVKPDRETLDLLGVNNSSVLMANSSIWVEGPTDRKYISNFLKLFCQNQEKQYLKEDIDFAFFEYGGSLIEHYLFDSDFEEIFTEQEVRDKINAFALSNKIYLLADDDNAKGKKLQRREKLEEISSQQAYFQYQNTNYREIENLLPVKVIKDFLYELVNISEKAKIENINFKRNQYIKVGLGQFILTLFEKNNIKGYKKFKDESGTLKSSYKTKLCDFVINGNYSYDDLIFENEELDKIVTDLYSFIKPK